MRRYAGGGGGRAGSNDRRLIAYFHAAFATVAIASLAARSSPQTSFVSEWPLGLAVLGLVLLYTIGWGLITWRAASAARAASGGQVGGANKSPSNTTLLPGKGAGKLHAQWRFAQLTSLCMVAPDAYLAFGLGALEFPLNGCPRLGPVNLYMAFMWTIPFVAILHTCAGLSKRWRGLGGAAAALAVFGAAEHFCTEEPLRLWGTTSIVKHR
jgi:hypothetical protein